VKKQTKENIQTTLIVAGMLVIILALSWSVITLWNSSNEQEEDRVVVLELKTDLLYLHRQIDTMPDKQALQSVLVMEKRLKQAELEVGRQHSKSLQRWLGESNDIMLRLHDDLRERDIHAKHYPEKPIVY
jgi:hypothetical protein